MHHNGSRSPCFLQPRDPITAPPLADPAAGRVVHALVCGAGAFWPPGWGLVSGTAVGNVSLFTCHSTATSGKKQAAKSKEELAQEKKKELEKRLQDVSGQLNSKKPTKKGNRPGLLLSEDSIHKGQESVVNLLAPLRLICN